MFKSLFEFLLQLLLTQQTLKNLATDGITTIVIAHRLSTVRDADCIYVLKKGSLNESGRH